MEPKDFESEEFINLCKAAAFSAISKFYKDERNNKQELFVECYAYILSKKQALKTYSMADEQELFYKVFKLSINAILAFTKERKEIKFADIKDFCVNNIPNQISCYEILNTQDLKNLLHEYLQNYTKKEQRCIMAIIEGARFNKISHKEHLKIPYLSKMMDEFRINFAEFLLDCGYFENINAVKLENKRESEIKSERARAKNEKYSNLYQLYRNDLFVYQLIRENIILAPDFAESLQISENELKEIVLHKTLKKLYFYQIQKLRKEFFPTYTLQELGRDVSCYT